MTHLKNLKILFLLTRFPHTQGITLCIPFPHIHREKIKVERVVFDDMEKDERVGL